MPSHKSQHYVPQFYLRYFSLDNNKKNINLFNLESQKYIVGASIRHQSCKDYFYGKDGAIESSLGQLESRSEEVFSNMIRNNIHPSYRTKEHDVILAFTFFLHLRTVESAETQNEMLDRFVKQIVSKDPKIKDHLDSFRAVYDNPTGAALQMMSSWYPILMDLAYKIILNCTERPFITSDHPVVLYNQFLESRRTIVSNTGLASKGLQVFFPISPKHLLLFYDKDTYKVHGMFHRPVPLRNVADIDSINGIQSLNATANLYFNGAVGDSYIRKLVEQFAPFKRKSRATVKEFDGRRTPDGHMTSFLLTYKEDIKCNLALDFVRLTKEAKQFTMDTRLAYYRNEGLVRVHDEFMAEVEKGRYNPAEFDSYLKARIDEMRSHQPD
jgi:hypothetical protein